VEKIQIDSENDKMLHAFLEGAHDGSISIQPHHKSGKRYVQHKLFQETLAVDPPRAVVAIEAWAEFLRHASGQRAFPAFSSIDEYIPYRILDVGEMLGC
jgi:hypothetical protein